MKHNMYSILDKTAAEFSPPWVAKNDAVAVRQMDMMFATEKYPKTDFQLFKVGTFEDTYPATFENDFNPVEINLGSEA